MKRLTTATLLALLAVPATAWAGAEGPGTPQATAANATFLANAPAPPAGGGVCVIDSGVDTDTDLGPALVSRVAQIGGVSGDPGDAGSVSDTGDALPKHGTYVAGVVASQPDGIGTSGIWPAAKIYSSRVFAGAATTTVNDYIRAMAWCSNQAGVKVINLSLSGLGATTIAQRDSLNDKITEVLGAPYFINVVAAAGNNGSATTVGYPASANGVFAVGATNSSGVIAPFSNRGAGLDISTLGVDVCITTSRGTRLASGDGTSYAAPLVSASLAALRSYDPALSPAHAEQLLLDGADIVNGFRSLTSRTLSWLTQQLLAWWPGRRIAGSMHRPPVDVKRPRRLRSARAVQRRRRRSTTLNRYRTRSRCRPLRSQPRSWMFRPSPPQSVRLGCGGRLFDRSR